MTIKKCEQCKKEFRKWGKPRGHSVYRFCSQRCYWDNMTVLLTCKICSVSFKRKSNGILKYCYDCWKNNRVEAWNKGKSNSWMIGEKNHKWAGGISSLQELIRGSIPYREWQRQIAKRDKYICQICYKACSRDMNIDHIRPLSTILREEKILSLEDALLCDDIWDITNGRVLCVACHKQTDTYGIKLLLKYEKGDC